MSKTTLTAKLLNKSAAVRRARARKRATALAASQGRDQYSDIDGLVDWHFTKWADPGHVNRVGMTIALRHLGERPALIVETGTSAWGTDSSRLWTAYVNMFGGEFWSVDIRPEASEALKSVSARAHYAVGDSVQFLSNFTVPSQYAAVDVAYLDSYDLDIHNPWPAMEHGLAEWLALTPHLAPGSVVVVDDTPIEPYFFGPEAAHFRDREGFIPGKGALILRDADILGDFKILYHHYDVVLQKR